MTDVSVVLAAYNEQRWIRAAVESILAQEGLEFELIVVDDNSTDETYSILSEIESRSTRLKVVKNPKKGKVSAFNFGVAMARGDWVCLFAGDDVMPEGSLAARWRGISDVNSERPVVGLCRIQQISEVKSQDGIIVPRDPLKGVMSGQSYLMDRRAVKEVFPVPEQFPNEDTWIEIAIIYLSFHVIHTPVIGCFWRVHEGNSINYLSDFTTFHKRIGIRMSAYRVFLDRRGTEMASEARHRLEARAACEEARSRGSIIGILASGASIRDKLRALLLVNPFMYRIRSRFYRLISGW